MTRGFVAAVMRAMSIRARRKAATRQRTGSAALAYPTYLATRKFTVSLDALAMVGRRQIIRLSILIENLAARFFADQINLLGSIHISYWNKGSRIEPISNIC
jgi:hypothetical protein